MDGGDVHLDDDELLHNNGGSQEGTVEIRDDRRVEVGGRGW